MYFLKIETVFYSGLSWKMMVENESCFFLRSFFPMKCRTEKEQTEAKKIILKSDYFKFSANQ
jgi:hypothetical protein